MQMKKKKTVLYAGAIVLIMAGGVLMQYGIRWTSGFFSGQIREKFSKEPEIMTEAPAMEEGGRFVLTKPGETEEDGTAASAVEGSFSGANEITVAAGENSGEPDSSEDSHAAETRATLEGLTAYHNANMPKVTGNESDIKALVGDRNQSFVNAVLNYLYAYFRDQYRVEEIHLLEKVQEKDGLLDYQMELFLTQGKNKGYATFICRYDTKEDVYTIFGSRDATGKG